MTALRRAARADVEGIAAVIRDVWGQDLLRSVYSAQIADDASTLWVAAEDGEVAGFASAFLTVTGDDRRRWEIDLVAVRTASQGHGLGTRLIGQACEAGQAHAVSLTRALIRVENVPSQRAFEAAGFSTDVRVYKLLLWPPEPGGNARPYAGPVTLLPVDTLTYRGLWIEALAAAPADEQRRALRAARSIAARESRANVGAVIPADEEHLLAYDLRNQARMHGEYCWFMKRVKRET